MKVVYNEIDPFAAEWLRQLISAGQIPHGIVDERSIEDVPPADLIRFGGVNLFAGIGVWGYALRLAGWPDNRPVWTCSCPCQPFSSAGKGDGFADERHLWPAAFHLIRECRPEFCFGEQVASKDGIAWLDLVQADLEAVGYTVGATVTPAAGFGAPHGRHRIYWVAHTDGHGRNETGCDDSGYPSKNGKRSGNRTSDGSKANVVVDSETTERRRSGNQRYSRSGIAETGGSSVVGDVANPRGVKPVRVSSGKREEVSQVGLSGSIGDVGNTSSVGIRGNSGAKPGPEEKGEGERESVRRLRLDPRSSGFTRGFWSECEWLHCRPEPSHPKGRWRSVETGTFPLAHESSCRVGRLRGYGNGLVAEQAAEFIKAFQEIKGIA